MVKLEQFGGNNRFTIFAIGNIGTSISRLVIFNREGFWLSLGRFDLHSSIRLRLIRGKQALNPCHHLFVYRLNLG